MRVDVDAIVEIAETIASRLDEAGRPRDALSLFSSVSSLIPLPGMADAMEALKICWIAFWLEEEEQARSLLGALSTIGSTNCSSLLEVYLHLIDMPPLQGIELVRRILSLRKEEESPNHSTILHYTGTLAIYRLILGDEEGARLTVVEEASALLPTVLAQGDSYSLLTAGETYELQWRFGLPGDPLEKALQIYSDLAANNNLRPAGKADMLIRAGTLSVEANLLVRGIEYLEQSLLLVPGDPVAVIHLAEAFAKCEKPQDALLRLYNLDTSGFPPGLQLEYLTVQAMAALAAKENALALRTVEMLKALDLRDLYFSNARDEVCISLLEFLASPRVVPASVQKAGGALQASLRLLRRFWRAVMLRPNFMGVGIDLKKLFYPENVEEGTNRHESDSTVETA